MKRLTINDLRLTISSFFLLPLAFSLSGCRPAAAPVSVSNKPVSVNNIPKTNLPLPLSKPLGEMSWTGLNDEKTQKLKDLNGKVVVLDFWATFCPPCLEEIPHLNELQTKYGAENLQIIGVHAGDDEDLAKVPEFVKKLNVIYPVVTPENALLRFVFATQDEIPQTLVFDRSGNLVEKFVGFDITVKNRLDKAVEQSVNTK